MEVEHARQHKKQLLAEREKLYRLKSEWAEKLRRLEEAVLRGLGKDPDRYSLELSPDGQTACFAESHPFKLAELLGHEDEQAVGDQSFFYKSIYDC